MEITKTYRFEASHILPKHPGKCSRLHGHSWVLHVSVEGPINPETGFVMDFGDISKVVKPLVESLDHRHLGTWACISDLSWAPRQDGFPLDFYPTSENLLWWIAGQIGPLDLYRVRKDGLEDTHLRAEPGSLIMTANPENIEKIVWWNKISIEETCTSQALLTREEFDNES